MASLKPSAAPGQRDALKALIRAAFQATPPPDPANLRGSNEGDEPYLLEDEFHEVPEWNSLDAEFLDQSPDGYGSALSFFSREAFRYYLPAYMLADLDDALDRADPAFHLWHGLDNGTREQPLNPRRYGAWTWFEAITLRLSEFTHDEAEAIVAYLRHKAAHEPFNRRRIEEALENYWLPRLKKGR